MKVFRSGRISWAVLILGVLVAIGALAFSRWKPTERSEFGEFEGRPKTEWLTQNRDMRLLADFAYIDDLGKRWPAPAGTIVDGASIPRAFWTVVGAPFSGSYRDASLIHDYACDFKTEPWQEVHLAFYKACRCANVAETHAKILYAAVFNYGPRWNLPGDTGGPYGATADEPEIPQPTEDEARAIAEKIKRDNPSLEEIEQMAGVRE